MPAVLLRWQSLTSHVANTPGSHIASRWPVCDSESPVVSRSNKLTCGDGVPPEHGPQAFPLCFSVFSSIPGGSAVPRHRRPDSRGTHFLTEWGINASRVGKVLEAILHSGVVGFDFAWLSPAWLWLYNLMLLSVLKNCQKVFSPLLSSFLLELDLHSCLFALHSACFFFLICLPAHSFSFTSPQRLWNTPVQFLTVAIVPCFCCSKSPFGSF